VVGKKLRCRFCNAELTPGNLVCDACHIPQMRGTLADREIRQLIEKDIIVVLIPSSNLMNS